MPEKKEWKKYIKKAGNVLVIISILFIIQRIMNLEIDYNEYISLSRLTRLIPVLLILTIWIFFQFIPWGVIIHAITDVRVSMISTCRAFLRANIMKYIPGNVFQYIGRAEIAEEDARLNIANVAASIIMESVAVLIAALIVGFVGAKSYTKVLLAKESKLLLVGLFFLVAMIVIAVIFREKIKMFLLEKNFFLSGKGIFALIFTIFYFAIGFTLQGVLIILVMKTISGEDFFPLLLTISGAYSISWVAGYITPGASGGIGIREAVMCMLLQGTVSAEIVIISVLIYRVINILADFFAYIVSLGLKKPGFPRIHMMQR